MLGLRFYVRAFSSCGEWGPLFIAVRGPLTIAASLVEHRLQTRRLSSRGSRAQLLRGMWDPPRPGLEPTSPASAGRLSTTAPPGKPPHRILVTTSGDRNDCPYFTDRKTEAQRCLKSCPRWASEPTGELESQPMAVRFHSLCPLGSAVSLEIKLE